MSDETPKRRGGARPGNPRGIRGGARHSTRPNTKRRGPLPDLLASAQEIGEHLSNSGPRYTASALLDLAEQLTVLQQQIADILPPPADWNGEVL